MKTEAMEANKRIKERKQMHQRNQENNNKKKENTGNYNMDKGPRTSMKPRTERI
jgi:hypothetical protein